MNMKNKVSIVVVALISFILLVNPLNVHASQTNSNVNTKINNTYVQPGTTTYISNEQVLDKLTSEGYNIHDLYSQSTLNQLYNEDLLRSGSNWDHIDGDTRTVGISSELFNFKKRYYD